ncbi:MAG TPA: VCBS repeat-containing protein, partial [Flavobacteriales bacterium]|nr:VCBS repeat-containing protein [Flavobacteriales bacterium]
MRSARNLAWSALFLFPLFTNAQLLPPDTLSWSMANGAQCVKADDLDGDGDNDVVVGTLRGHHVLLYWNPGDGEFGAPQFVMAAEGVYDLELADVDLDGLLDIVVADFGNGWVSWCANLGGGTFAPRAVLIDDIFTTGITALEVGQGDADNEVELFTLNYNGRVGLFQDNGSQQFGTGQTLFNTGPPAFGLDIFSFTATFRWDVVAGGDEVWMRSNTGPGFLASQPVQLSSLGGDVSAVAFNRGNSGSLQDVSVHVASEGTGQQRIWSGFQNGTPSLVNTTSYDGITDIVHYVINDQNPNNWWNLIASHTLHGIVGGGVFYTPSKAWGLRSIAVADMDGDGITDLLWCGDEDDDVAWVKRDGSAAGYPERRMTPLSGGTCPPRFADLDGDG